VQAVEEAGDVLGLRADAGASGGDDFGIQAEALGDIDSGGRPRNADTQFVGWL